MSVDIFVCVAGTTETNHEQKSYYSYYCYWPDFNCL